MSKKVCVVGSGIIGLGSALHFLRNGHRVTIVSSPTHFMPTSPVSAAFWFPYACSLSVEQEIALAEPTYRFLKECMLSRDSGISIRKGRAYFDETVEPAETTTPWWAEMDTNFRQLASNEIPPSLRENQSVGPIIGGWYFEVPVIHIPTFLSWLQREVEALGGEVKEHRVASFNEIDASYDWIVNCAGGWATHLTSDPVLVGYQGTVIDLPGEPLGDELLFLEKGKSSNLPTYIVPQGLRTILGGTFKPITQPGEAWQTGSDGATQQWVGTEDDVRGIIERCQIVSGKAVPLTPGSSWKSKAGLRPVRSDSPPRIEMDSNSPRVIVHNYGHGGSGVTFFWGSAQTAYDLAQKMGSA
jgi:D-amino-acid oxidase